jgi:hypothetical protein
MPQRSPLTGREAKPSRERVRISALIAEADVQRNVGQRKPRIGE